VTVRPLALPADAVLLRLPVEGRDWPTTLPAVPEGGQVTVTLGHPELVPADPGPARARGYHVVGAASEHRPLGSVADLLITADLRDAAPAWWEALLGRASRVFDLRLGPVQQVLSAELALHVDALES
jgi:hypothetical protein